MARSLEDVNKLSVGLRDSEQQCLLLKAELGMAGDKIDQQEEEIQILAKELAQGREKVRELSVEMKKLDNLYDCIRIDHEHLTQVIRMNQLN